VKCPACGSENRDDARFCKQCGNSLETPIAPVVPPIPARPVVCPACGATNNPRARFCARCGKALAEITAPEAADAVLSPAEEVKTPSPEAPVSPPLPVVDQVRVVGGVSGQIAVGENNLQIRIGDVHGGEVNVLVPDQQPAVRPRPTPAAVRPRPFPGLLDREDEVKAAATALQSAMSVEFHGRAGLGKTSLLRYLAYHSIATSFPDGVITLTVRRQPVGDVLQSLFDVFYESNVPFKPSMGQIRQGLRDKQALILLDDVTLEREEMATLMDAVPACSFLLASAERRLWGEGQPIKLGGLPLDDGLALMERELRRALTSQEKPAAQALYTELGGNPLQIFQAAALVREEGLGLAEVLQRTRAYAPGEALTAQMLSTLSEPERRVLAALAALDGLSVHTDHLPALTGLSEVTPVLQGLQQRGLVQAHSPRYSLTGDLGSYLHRSWNIDPWIERALAVYVAWAGERRDPDRLLEESETILWLLEWATGAEHWVEALRLSSLVEGTLALGGRWSAWAEVLKRALEAALALGNRAAEAWVRHQLGSRALCLGDGASARTFLVQALRLREALGDGPGVALTRHNLDVLLGAPALPEEPAEAEPPSQGPPQPPPEAPAAPAPIPPSGIPVVVKVALIALVPIMIVVGSLGAWYLWLRPTPTPPPTAVPPTPTSTATPSPTPTVTPSPTPTSTPTDTPTPTNTPTVTPSPTSTPDTVGPAAPSLLVPEPDAQIACDPYQSEQRVQLEWGAISDPSGVQGYDVALEAIEMQPTEYPGWFASEPGLEIVVNCNEIYRWRVRAVDGAGNAGAWSDERDFALVDVSGPPAPVLLEPLDGADIPCPTGEAVAVELAWDPVADPSGIARYDIDLILKPDYPPVTLTSTVQVEGNRSSMTIDIFCGDRYEWRVRAVDGLENAGQWSEWRSLRVLTLKETDQVPPPVPNPLGPGDPDEASPESVECPVTLRWDPVSDPSGVSYLVTLEVGDGLGGWDLAYSDTTSDPHWEAVYPNCDPGRIYRWHVRSRDGAMNLSEGTSEWLHYGIPLP
jgi:hypothetical protein